MIIKKEEIDKFSLPLHIDKLIFPLENHLLLDIETTGFSPKFATVYLVGCCFYQSNHWHYIQWFAETLEEEKDILSKFFLFLKNYKNLVHFNGNQFDLPFIRKRAESLQIPISFEGLHNIDLYGQILPLKKFLNLPNCKQKTIESFLQINRQDTFSGGELIPYYKEYLKHPTETNLNFLLLHNKEDIIGMIHLLPILSYVSLFKNSPNFFTLKQHTYLTNSNQEEQELLFTFSTEYALPIPISYRKENCYFTGREDQILIRVPIIHSTLKFFYDNHKEYFYLPEEDMAIHQSVATFVDKSYKKKATPSTCYIKKEGCFLHQWKPVISPCFRMELKSLPLYFEATEEFFHSTSQQQNYLQHLLNWIL